MKMSDWLNTNYVQLVRTLRRLLVSKQYLVLQCACLVIAAICVLVLVGMSRRNSRPSQNDDDGSSVKAKSE
jgi:hypothetical protein